MHNSCRYQCSHPAATGYLHLPDLLCWRRKRQRSSHWLLHILSRAAMLVWAACIPSAVQAARNVHVIGISAKTTHAGRVKRLPTAPWANTPAQLRPASTASACADQPVHAPNHLHCMPTVATATEPPGGPLSGLLTVGNPEHRGHRPQQQATLRTWACWYTGGTFNQQLFAACNAMLTQDESLNQTTVTQLLTWPLWQSNGSFNQKMFCACAALLKNRGFPTYEAVGDLLSWPCWTIDGVFHNDLFHAASTLFAGRGLAIRAETEGLFARICRQFDDPCHPQRLCALLTLLKTEGPYEPLARNSPDPKKNGLGNRHERPKNLVTIEDSVHSLLSWLEPSDHDNKKPPAAHTPPVHNLPVRIQQECHTAQQQPPCCKPHLSYKKRLLALLPPTRDRRSVLQIKQVVHYLALPGSACALPWQACEWFVKAALLHAPPEGNKGPFLGGLLVILAAHGGAAVQPFLDLYTTLNRPRWGGRQGGEATAPPSSPQGETSKLKQRCKQWWHGINDDHYRWHLLNILYVLPVSSHNRLSKRSSMVAIQDVLPTHNILWKLLQHSSAKKLTQILTAATNYTPEHNYTADTLATLLRALLLVGAPLSSQRVKLPPLVPHLTFCNRIRTGSHAVTFDCPSGHTSGNQLLALWVAVVTFHAGRITLDGECFIVRKGCKKVRYFVMPTLTTDHHSMTINNWSESVFLKFFNDLGLCELCEPPDHPTHDGTYPFPEPAQPPCYWPVACSDSLSKRTLQMLVKNHIEIDTDIWLPPDNDMDKVLVPLNQLFYGDLAPAIQTEDDCSLAWLLPAPCQSEGSTVG